MKTLASKPKKISFRDDYIRSILNGRKTISVKPINPQPPEWATFLNHCTGYNIDMKIVPWYMYQWCEPEKNPPAPLKRWPDSHYIPCPYGRPGDSLCVQETWRVRGGKEYEYQKHQPSVVYKASADITDSVCSEWNKAIMMPAWASRMSIKITDLRVKRIQDLTEEEAIAEGVDDLSMENLPRQATFSRKTDFKQIWHRMYRARNLQWEKNPWVWVLSFEKMPEAW